MVLVDRDYVVMREIERWRFCLSRHIRILAGFSGGRACDRRLKILVDAGYIEWKMVLYGVPRYYYLSRKGKNLIGTNARQDKIRVEKISHDIAVLDTVIYFMQKHNLRLENITTEKQLHSKDGFSSRKHCPDYIFTDTENNCTCCVEIELTAKAKNRLEKNIEENYLNYETQYWIVSKTGFKIRQMLKEFSEKYQNIKIIDLEEVQESVKFYKEDNKTE